MASNSTHSAFAGGKHPAAAGPKRSNTNSPDPNANQVSNPSRAGSPAPKAFANIDYTTMMELITSKPSLRDYVTPYHGSLITCSDNVIVGTKHREEDVHVSVTFGHSTNWFVARLVNFKADPKNPHDPKNPRDLLVGEEAKSIGQALELLLSKSVKPLPAMPIYRQTQ